MSKSGFDPSRLVETRRDRPVIPQILSPETPHLAKGFTEIKVIGLGGAGLNTVDRMIGAGLQGIDFIAVNTDEQSLLRSSARTRVMIGQRLTRGRGTGGETRLGERAAESSEEELTEALRGADMIFLTGGMGGGTGTGAMPVLAHVARRMGALSVAVVTLPFAFEGRRRRELAEDGLSRLRGVVDALIVVSNDRLLQLATPADGIHHAFALADETLRQGIYGIADLILTPGLINLDFADVRAVMERAGSALMAIGEATGEGRAGRAADTALASPLLEAPIKGARGVLLNVTGGDDLTLQEVNEVAERISHVTAPDCNLIFGAVVHPKLNGHLRLTVIATGFSGG